MREHEIRRALLDDLRCEHPDDSLIVEELGLNAGEIRVDVAVVNGLLAGYEIKSDWDTLYRLPAQQAMYSRVFDRVTVVVGQHHLDAVSALVPGWWGLSMARAGRVEIQRAPTANENTDPDIVVRLLWRSEALRTLQALGETGLERAPRRVLWTMIVDRLSREELAGEVRRSLKERTGWSTVRPRVPGDGSSHLDARS
jgi:hypothetical protein